MQLLLLLSCSRRRIQGTVHTLPGQGSCWEARAGVLQTYGLLITAGPAQSAADLGQLPGGLSLGWVSYGVVQELLPVVRLTRRFQEQPRHCPTALLVAMIVPRPLHAHSRLLLRKSMAQRDRPAELWPGRLFMHAGGACGCAPLSWLSVLHHAPPC